MLATARTVNTLAGVPGTSTCGHAGDKITFRQVLQGSDQLSGLDLGEDPALCQRSLKSWQVPATGPLPQHPEHCSLQAQPADPPGLIPNGHPPPGRESGHLALRRRK